GGALGLGDGVGPQGSTGLDDHGSTLRGPAVTWTELAARAVMERLPPPTTAPAGWYPDPVTDGVRYFDGVRWHGAAGPVGTPFGVEPLEEHPDLPLPAALGALLVLV